MVVLQCSRTIAWVCMGVRCSGQGGRDKRGGQKQRGVRRYRNTKRLRQDERRIKREVVGRTQIQILRQR